MCALPAGPGCRHATPCPSPEYQPATYTLDLPSVRPGPLPVTVVAKPAPGVGPTYRRLTEAECLTLAVRNCGPAHRLDREQFEALATCRSGSNGRAKADALGHAADELRNRAGGDALDLYAKLVAAEAGRQVYAEAAADLAALLDEAATAMKLGVKEPDDIAELERQHAEVRAEIAKLDGSIRELNHGLRALLGVDENSPGHFWPDAPTVRPVDLDIDRALSMARTYRPDILLPKSLHSSPDPLAPQIARQLLGATNPFLGLEPGSLPPGLGLLGRTIASFLRLPVPGPTDSAQTQRQVAGLTGDRETLATAEVRAAADRVTACAARAVVYRDAVESLGSRVADLERTRDAGRPVTVPLANAKAAWRKAKGQLIVAATDHQAAVAKFRQSQGLLVREVMDPAFAGGNRP